MKIEQYCEIVNQLQGPSGHLHCDLLILGMKYLMDYSVKLWLEWKIENEKSYIQTCIDMQ